MTAWPALDWSAWRETAIGLQLRTQIVGKIRLALTPWLNHSWHVPFYVSARGLTTSAIPLGDRILQIDFDFIDDVVAFATSDGGRHSIPLAAGSIADFHAAVCTALAVLGVTVTFDGRPSEMADLPPFAEDTAERPYDADAARAFWRALIQVARVFGQFRTGFLGKASPVHFFWGSSISPRRASRGGLRPNIPAVFPACPIR